VWGWEGKEPGYSFLGGSRAPFECTARFVQGRSAGSRRGLRLPGDCWPRVRPPGRMAVPVWPSGLAAVRARWTISTERRGGESAERGARPRIGLGQCRFRRDHRRLR
jgi:hypothetical protein